MYFLVDHLKFKNMDNAHKEEIYYHVENTVVKLNFGIKYVVSYMKMTVKEF